MYFRLTLDDVLHFNCDDKPPADANLVDIATIAFNNELVIAHQIRLLKKYFLDPYAYTVADNSTDPLKQEKIMRLCRELDTAYIRLPGIPCKRINSSLSHGFALNWIYKNYFHKRKADFFGFLDHDIYPVRPIKIRKILQETTLYGLTQSRIVPGQGFRWYLHPGLCFFKYDYVKNKKVNFMPGYGCDTGGGNWRSLYQDFDRTILVPLAPHYVRLREGDDPQVDNFIEYTGDWLHTCNGSNWRKTPDKNDLIDELLNKY
ncbi:MAG: hypothetical protein AB1767_04255 [Bacillota bacterium]